MAASSPLPLPPESTATATASVTATTAASAVEPPHFSHLSTHVRLYTPPPPAPSSSFPDASTSDASLPPSARALIIFCPWLGASERHIAKYASLVHRVRPDATILLVPSTIRTLFASSGTIAHELRPGVEIVREFVDGESGNRSEDVMAKGSERDRTSGDARRIYIYGMSNGGCFNIIRLLRAVREARRLPSASSSLPSSSSSSSSSPSPSITSPPLPVSAMILDSCPGQGTYRAGMRAMQLSVPMPRSGGAIGRLLQRILLRAPLLLVLRLVLALYSVLNKLGWKHPIQKTREAMLDRRLLVGGELTIQQGTMETTTTTGTEEIGKKQEDEDNSASASSSSAVPSPPQATHPAPAPVRTRYIYSKADELVRWTDVASHADVARRQSGPLEIVDEVVFEDSAHCAHYLRDPERYERALSELLC